MPENKISGAERVKALFHAPSLSEGAHKAGCACGWCKNKGNIGKKKKAEAEAAEPEVPKEVAEGRDDTGKLGLGKKALAYNRMTSTQAMSGKKPQMYMDMTAEVTNQTDRMKGFAIQDKGEDTSGKKLKSPKLKESAMKVVNRMLDQT